MKHELRIFVFFISMILASLFMIHPLYAADDHPCSLKPQEQARKDYETTYGPCPGGLDQIEGITANVISVVVGLGFIATLVLVVMAGFKYLTSGGEPKAIQSAHYTLSWAILGLVIMAVAWIILQLIAAFTGADVTVFNIKALCDITGKNFCKP